MYVTLFRSVKRAGYDLESYADDSERMAALASMQPGFIEFKSFTASDGETLSLSMWESERAAHNWAQQPEHLVAQARGRVDYYQNFTIYGCADPKIRRFDHDVSTGDDTPS